MKFQPVPCQNPVRYYTLSEQLHKLSENVKMFAEGVRRFITGLSKKVLLANNIGLLWHTIASSNPGSMSALTAWLGIIAFGKEETKDVIRQGGYQHNHDVNRFAPGVEDKTN